MSWNADHWFQQEYMESLCELGEFRVLTGARKDKTGIRSRSGKVIAVIRAIWSKSYGLIQAYDVTDRDSKESSAIH